ncbi:hypothetical protein V7161_28730 [Neobacillus drentensis]|uniref:hypothetical protein n=1 Tax=Neobacillus drentensis TaxID=220684 RepID=UPI0030018A8C
MRNTKAQSLQFITRNWMMLRNKDLSRLVASAALFLVPQTKHISLSWIWRILIKVKILPNHELREGDIRIFG